MASERPGLPSCVSVHKRVLDSLIALWDLHWNHLTHLTLRHHTFGSAGSDGIVSIWDHTAKKRLRQYPKYHNAVNDISFNMNGTKLAVGVSYGWEKGESASKLAENARVSVFIREIGDEVKVRSLLCGPMRDTELFTLTIKSSSQKRRREPASFGRVSKYLSLSLYVLPPMDHTAISALMYPSSSNTAISTCIPDVHELPSQPAGKRLLWTLGRFPVPTYGLCSK